ncbi:hypothetical protein V2J09_017985 [Rumex salicifolius]
MRVKNKKGLSQEQRGPRVSSSQELKRVSCVLKFTKGSCDYDPSKMSQEKRGPRVFSRVKNKEGLSQEQRGPRVFSRNLFVTDTSDPRSFIFYNSQEDHSQEQRGPRVFSRL